MERDTSSSDIVLLAEGSGAASLVLRRGEIERERYPSASFSVALDTPVGQVQVADAWLAADDVQVFAAALTQLLAHVHKSQVELVSMSPADLQIRLCRHNLRGQFRVAVAVGKQHYAEDGTLLSTTVSSEFVAETQALDDFRRALLTAVGSQSSE